jgi:hypothetical protein
MLAATLWQVDMGDGTWAVCCLVCQTPLYRGPKPIADLIFDTQCASRSSPSPPPDHREAPMKLRPTGTEAGAPGSPFCCATDSPTWRSQGSARRTPTAATAPRSASTWRSASPWPPGARGHKDAAP